MTVSLKSARRSIESKRSVALGWKNGFFRPNGQNRVISASSKPVCKEDERRSAANPDVASPPANAVPETLSLPDAVVIGDIGRTAVIAVTGSIITRPITIIARTGKRAADDGPADQSRQHSGGNPASAGFGGVGQRHGRPREGGGGSECHQFLLHDVTFLNRARTIAARRGKGSMYRLNDP